MNVPKPRQLPSGMWFIQLRLGGESISITNADEKQCIKEAEYRKAEYRAGKRAKAVMQDESVEEKSALTVKAACEQYMKSKSNTLSPATLRGYTQIMKHRFQDIMQRLISEISDDEWQLIVNEEAAKCSAKYLKNAYSFIRTSVYAAEKRNLPEITLPQVPPIDTPFLQPEEIKKFVSAVSKTQYAVPALLALSSMRMSEMQALDWKNIPQNPDFIHTNGAVVVNAENKLVRKKQNKNQTSSRNVPILIPELKAALEANRKPSGPVMEISRDRLRVNVQRICREEGITIVTVHGLRHSFASLAYHLRIPEKIAQDIGGWKDSGTMHKIYTHVAQSDITRYKAALYDFYNPAPEDEKSDKNANKNANEK